MSVQTFKEFFLSRLLTCPNFSWGSCRATVCKRRREIIGGEVCLAIRRQENLTTCWYYSILQNLEVGKFQTISCFQKSFPQTFFLQKLELQYLELSFDNLWEQYIFTQTISIFSLSPSSIYFHSVSLNEIIERVWVKIYKRGT